ncbi:MAG TPA: outer membrane beta-barrel protein [Terracidiphilus sp.]|jgi:opacity protein-like surface antigen
MQKRFLSTAVLLVASAVIVNIPAPAQTDVALSVYGAFSGATDANGYTQSPANAAGGMFELRHIANPILGFEGTYSFNRDNQNFKADPTCGVSCGNVTSATVKADAHEVTLDWVPSVGIANVHPFGVLGIGALFDVPQSGSTSSQISVSTQTVTKAVYVYGAGLDWGLVPHIGLRLQYRGNLYKTPNVTQLFTSADKFTHTAEPMIGIYFRL